MLRLPVTCPWTPDSKSFLSLFPDPHDGVAVGCIDFSLIPESRVVEKVARGEGKGNKRGKGESR